MNKRKATGTTPGPALSEGWVGQENKRTNQAAQPNHARDAPNPDIKIPKHLKEPKEKDEDLKTRKAPGTTQGENSNPNTLKLPEVIQGGENPGNRTTVERGGDVKVN